MRVAKLVHFPQSAIESSPLLSTFSVLTLTANVASESTRSPRGTSGYGSFDHVCFLMAALTFQGVVMKWPPQLNLSPIERESGAATV